MKKLNQLLLSSPEDDRGATLILVLFIVSFMGLAGAALLTFSDTSILTTIQLRNQASNAYSADGAAQVAVKRLGAGTFPCTTASGQTLSNFYPGTNGATASSAYVWCTPDQGNGMGGSATSANTSPGTALLALDSNLTENGITANINAGALKIRGAIFSNSKIDASGGIANTWQPPASDPSRTTYNIARGACAGNITPTDLTKCLYGSKPDVRGDDPGTLTPHGASYDAPPAPSGLGVIGNCNGSKKFQTVTPGLFTVASKLNNLTGCSNKVVWFKPGKYYFDFTAANIKWNPAAPLFIIAGTSTLDLNTTKPTPAGMPTACIAPEASNATAEVGTTPGTGAEFVFGGNSRLSLNDSSSTGAQLTICASPTSASSGGGPPIAIYGLKTALTGVFPVAAQTTCYTGSNTCSMISTGKSPKSFLTVQGTTYAPEAFIDIVLNNKSQKAFYWGLIAWAISFTGTGAADVSNGLVDVPDQATNPTPAVNAMYLDVYVCPASSACSTSGRLGLRAKVQVTGSTVNVLSWSVQR